MKLLTALLITSILVAPALAVKTPGISDDLFNRMKDRGTTPDYSGVDIDSEGTVIDRNVGKRPKKSPEAPKGKHASSAKSRPSQTDVLIETEVTEQTAQ